MYIIGDIGNTETKIYVYSTQKKIIKKIIIKSNLINNNYLKKNLSFIFKKKIDIKKVVFSSVVPKIFRLIKIFLSKNFKLKCFEIKELNINKLIKILVNRKQIGSDRLCNAIGINDNKNNYIIVDFGTATTFDVIIKNKYLGGIIAPGVSLSLNTLASKASLIPSLKLKKVKNVLGKNTISAVRSGFYWGYIGLVENIIDKISKHTKKKYKLILTGGYSHLFFKSIKNKAIIDKDITIKGILKLLNYYER
jgi:type III pantothenate kinase